MTITRLFACVLFASVVLASGVLHGQRIGRWTPLPPLDPYLARLDAVPMTVGDWVGTDSPLDPEELLRGGIQGHIHRHFRNAKTGDEVTVLVVCGRPGPISVHTPDICYRGAGYEAIGDQVREDVTVADGTRKLWMLSFRKPGGLPGRELEVRWAWTTGGKLEAPGNSRIAFATEPALFKVYLVRERQPGAKKTAGEPDFVRALAPAVEAALVAPPAAG